MPPVVQEPLRHAAEFKAFSIRILAARVYPSNQGWGQSKKTVGNDSTIVMKSLQVITHVFVDLNYLESGMMIKQHLALTAARWAHLTRHSGSAKQLNQAPGPANPNTNPRHPLQPGCTLCASVVWGESHGRKTHRRIAMQKLPRHTPGKLPSNGK